MKNLFQKRMEKHHDELRWLYMELYQNDDMFAELCSQLYEYDAQRGQQLKERTLRVKISRTGIRKTIF